MKIPQKTLDEFEKICGELGYGSAEIKFTKKSGKPYFLIIKNEAFLHEACEEEVTIEGDE